MSAWLPSRRSTRAPAGRLLDALRRPGAVVERRGERRERPVLLERHRLGGHVLGWHRVVRLSGWSGKTTTPPAAAGGGRRARVERSPLSKEEGGGGAGAGRCARGRGYADCVRSPSRYLGHHGHGQRVRFRHAPPVPVPHPARSPASWPRRAVAQARTSMQRSLRRPPAMRAATALSGNRSRRPPHRRSRRRHRPTRCPTKKAATPKRRPRQAARQEGGRGEGTGEEGAGEEGPGQEGGASGHRRPRPAKPRPRSRRPRGAEQRRSGP